MVTKRGIPGRARALARLLALATVLCAGQGWTAELRLRDPGEPLPLMALRDLDGQLRTVSPGRGDSPILLFFWSVNCPACKEAMPELAGLHRSPIGRNLSVWAVNVNGENSSNVVRAYAREMNLPFPVVYDRLEGDALIAADPLGVSKTPTLYLAGPDGKIALRQVIQLDLQAVSRALEALPR